MKRLHALVKATDAHTAMLAAVQDAAEQLRGQLEAEREQRTAAAAQPPTVDPIDYGNLGQAPEGQ